MLTERSPIDRILEATAAAASEKGSARLSVQDVATTAGVSKALIHYHFVDKESLLAQLVDWLSARFLMREAELLHALGPSQTIDTLWTWVDDERKRGELLVLIELGQDRSAQVREAVQRFAVKRREGAERTTSALFTALNLTPRVPTDLLADVFGTFMDGLVRTTTLRDGTHRRVLFDVFWLALLSLAD